jgi:N-acetylglucosamine kinase-like BadF-type ATPase
MIKLKDILSEGLYYVGYNKGRGQGTGVFKDSYSSYKDAKKAVEKLEKERGGSYNQIAYYVSDKDGKFVKESISEATMHHMTREKSLDNLKDVIQNIKPYSKEAVKHCEAAIAIIEKFDVR